MPFSWIPQEQGLTSAELTVRVQTLSPNDDGRLLWDSLMPRVDVDSVKLREILTTDWRPVSDRREWNANGRLIPVKTPNQKELEMVPVEDFFRLAEREMQELAERTFGNEELFRRMVGNKVPDRVDGLAMANYRRLEVDMFKAWLTNTITAMNPVTSTVVTTSLGMSASRYLTAGTAWNDAGLNAYDELLNFIENGVDLVGSVKGVGLRLNALKEIQKDAPNPYSNISGIKITRSQLEQRISDDIGSDFRFYVVENSLDVFTGGGTATSRTKDWPAQKLALIPDGPIGMMAFAPIARSWTLASQVPDAGIDVRGQLVHYTSENDGKALKVSAQVNALPVPNEQLMYVIDIGF